MTNICQSCTVFLSSKLELTTSWIKLSSVKLIFLYFVLSNLNSNCNCCNDKEYCHKNHCPNCIARSFCFAFTILTWVTVSWWNISHNFSTFAHIIPTSVANPLSRNNTFTATRMLFTEISIAAIVRNKIKEKTSADWKISTTRELA